MFKDHCLRSRGGLYYEDVDEFAEALGLLIEDARLRAALGASDGRYVEENYRWDVVLDKYRSLIRAVSS